MDVIKIPYSSKRQHRWMRWAESQGKLPKGTADEWAKKTPNMGKLPETANKEKSLVSFPKIIKRNNTGG